MAQAVVDVLEAIQVHEEHGEQVVGVADAPADGAGQPLHEQHPVRQVRQGIVNRVVHQAVLGGPEAGAHLVERPGHGHGLGAAARGELHRQVAARDVGGGRRDLAQRLADPPAEDQPARQRQAEHDQPAEQEAIAQLIHEHLGGLPVGQQHQPPRRVGHAIGGEGERAADIAVGADAGELGQHPHRGARRAPGERQGVAVASLAQARRRNPGPGQQQDLALGEPRQLLGEGIGQLVAHGQRAQHLVGKTSGSRDHQVQGPAAIEEHPVARATTSRRDRRGERHGLGFGGGPAGRGQPLRPRDR